MNERNPTNNNPSDSEDALARLERELMDKESSDADLPSTFEERSEFGGAPTQHGIRQARDQSRGVPFDTIGVESHTSQTSEHRNRAVFQRDVLALLETLFGREHIQNGEFVDAVSIFGDGSAQVGDIFFIVNYVYPLDSYPPVNLCGTERCEVVEKSETEQYVKIHLQSYQNITYRNELDVILTGDIMINHTVHYYRFNGAYSHGSDVQEIFRLQRQENDE